MRNKMYDKAIADFNEAVKLDPQNMEAVHNRAVIVGQQAQIKLEKRLRAENEKALEAQREHSRNLIAQAEVLDDWAAKQEKIQ